MIFLIGEAYLWVNLSIASAPYTFHTNYSFGSHPLIEEFSDVFSEDLLNKLAPLCDMQHAIDLVLGTSLPNMPHYRINSTEHAELKRQIDEFEDKGYIRESMSPCHHVRTPHY